MAKNPHAARNNGIDSVFFCSAIHATDDTHTGCTAKINPATQPPGTRIFPNAHQSINAPAACIASDTKRYPSATSKNRRHCTHSNENVSGK